jgi:hypothetical protein
MKIRVLHVGMFRGYARVTAPASLHLGCPI